MRYVRFSDVGFFLTPRTDFRQESPPPTHAQQAFFVARVCPESRIVSAGFVDFHEGKPHCHGRSESLNLGSLPDDSAELAKQLGIPLGIPL